MGRLPSILHLGSTLLTLQSCVASASRRSSDSLLRAARHSAGTTLHHAAQNPHGQPHKDRAV
jgi:hypothetical protein